MAIVWHNILLEFETKEICEKSKILVSTIEHRYLGKKNVDELWFEYRGVKYEFKDGGIIIKNKDELSCKIQDDVVFLDQDY